MSRLISYEEQAREGILKGVSHLEKAVKVTLGARGRNVLIQNKHNDGFHITKDGVTVANSVELVDPLESLGCEVIKKVASDTNKEVGDGTTTSIVLAKAMVEQGVKAINSGVNSISLKRGMDKATNKVLEHLDTIKTPINSADGSINKIATISANGDKEIGGIIADAFEKVGKHGVIKIDQASGDTHYISHVTGIGFDRGMLFPAFTGDINSDSVQLDNPLVLVTDHMIQDFSDFELSENRSVKLFEDIQKLNRPLLIICEDMDMLPAAQLMESLARRSFVSVVVKAPEFGDRRADMLGDIAAVLGAKFFSKESGLTMKDVTIEDLGNCSEVKVDQNNTVISEGGGTKSDVDERISLIQEKLKTEKAEYALAKLEERLAKLTGGIATINIGSRSELELKEIKDRVEDALNATKAALEDGIVAGGGIALFSAIKAIRGINLKDEDENHGVDVIRYALERPLFNILDNSGIDTTSIINRFKIGDLDSTVGYDVTILEYVDMIEAGIIDPVKVTKKAFGNASSISSTLLTTECAIYNPVIQDGKEVIPRF